jgi:diaminopimelate decarboxylase
MASNYNSRPRPAEVMVEDGQAFLVRRRETWEDLVAGEAVDHA